MILSHNGKSYRVSYDDTVEVFIPRGGVRVMQLAPRASWPAGQARRVTMAAPESPRRQLERSFAGWRCASPRATFHRAWRCGDWVTLRCDPRQRGRIVLIDRLLHVCWEPTGWEAEHYPEELVRSGPND